MALSGSFSNYPVSGFGLYCTWSATQSKTGNYSDVTLNVYLKYYSLYVGQRDDSTIAINGTSETYTVGAISQGSNTAHTTLLKTKTVRVNHNADGTKSGVALSASWRFSGTYSSVQIGTITASTTITLDSIDRTAPTVSFTSSSITSSGFSISAKSSATSDIWQYSTDGGSTWTQFSTTAGTTASKTITGLSPNTTYSVKVRARKQSNQVYGTSSAASIKTLGGAVLNSVSAVSADSATVTITLNATVYNASYTNKLVIKNGSTTILTITGISWAVGTANRTVTLTAAQRTTLLNAMASLKSFTGTFELSSFSGTTQIGTTSSKTATVQTSQANSGPTFTSFTYLDGNSITVAVTQDDHCFIQGYSKLYVTPGTATAKNGASISSYTYKCDNLNVTSPAAAETLVGTITASKNVDVVVTVTDSRGYSASVTKTITVIPYTKLKMNSITLRRTNEIEAEMQLIFSGSFCSVKTANTERNRLSYVRYRYKKTSDTTFSSYVNIQSQVTTSGLNFSFSNLELISLDAGFSFDFELTIRDILGTLTTQTFTFVVPQGTPLVSLRKQKVGINTPNPSAALHVVGNVKINDGILADFVVAEGKSGNWEYRKWANGKAECWGKVSLTGITINSAWGGLYTSGNLTGSAMTFPFEFKEIPAVMFSNDATGGASILMRGGNCTAASTKSTGTLEAVRGTTATTSIKINYYVVGKWK